LLKKMKDKFGWTHEQLAEKVRKSKAWVSQHLKMLELEKVHAREQESRDLLNEITEGQARALLSKPEEERKEILEHAEKESELPSARERRHFF